MVHDSTQVSETELTGDKDTDGETVVLGLITNQPLDVRFNYDQSTVNKIDYFTISSQFETISLEFNRQIWKFSNNQLFWQVRLGDLGPPNDEFTESVEVFSDCILYRGGPMMLDQVIIYSSLNSVWKYRVLFELKQFFIALCQSIYAELSNY